MIKKDKFKNKTLVYFSVLMLVFLVLAYLNFYLYQKIQEKKEDILVKKERVAKINLISSKLSQIKNNYKKNDEKISLLKSKFLNGEDDELKFIISIENLADKYNLSQSLNLGIQNKKINDYVFANEYKISLLGSFEDLVGFLFELRNIGFLNKIESANFKRVSDDKVNLDLVVIVYSL